MEQVVQIITTTQDLLITPLDHTTLQSLTIVTLGLQLLNLAITEVEDLHQLISLQEVVVIAEVEAVQDQEVHHLQVDQAEEAAVLPEVKEVVHRLNQEGEDKPIFIDYYKKINSNETNPISSGDSYGFFNTTESSN
jgi:hypothetical protein